MRIAYLDIIAGIAGDMTMAAFVSAGLPMDELASELKKLPVTGFELQGRHVMRSAIAAVQLDVVLSHTPHYHRHLKDIYQIIDASALSERVKDVSKKIFYEIAVAEAKIHNSTLEKIHFHEVGALDSLVDIVGVAICLEKFGIERVYTSPVKLGSGGTVMTQHGVMPTPTPATLEILKHYPTVLTNVPEELTTPTGAGIVKALSSGVLSNEQLSVHAVGWGAGTKEFPQLPNLLRVVIGELALSTEEEEIVIVETNIDDMNPQVYPYVIEKLLAAGAHDAYLIPIIMKKGRPGILLSVLTPTSKLDPISRIIYAQTTTIGLRILQVGRRKLPRRALELHTQFGAVKVKAVMHEGKEILAPEFDECKRIADERGMSVLAVQQALSIEIAQRAG
jgi:hypothetical protein